jgi:fructuronate reductase
MDGSQKLPQRLLGTVAARLAAGEPPVWTGLGVAAWMRHVWTERTDSGAPFGVNDPLAAVFRERLAGAGVSSSAADQAGAVAGALLGIREVFGSLTESAEFRSLLTGQLNRLATDGARDTVTALAAEAGS